MQKQGRTSRYRSHGSKFGRAFLAGALILLSCAAVESAQIDPVLKERLRAAITDTESFEDRFAATVWLTDMALRLEGRVPEADERMQILQHVHQEAQRANLHPELVLAVIDIESAFDRFAISVAGAQGLMQIMPFWLDELKQPNANLFDVQTNLRMGCTILRYYLDMENGELSPALARYNGSVGKRWYPERVLNRLSNRWFKS